MNLLIETNASASVVSSIAGEQAKDITIFRSKQSDGLVTLTHVLLVLTTTSLTLATKVIIELIKAKYQTKVKNGALEISGLTESGTLAVLEKLLANKSSDEGDHHGGA